MKQDGTGFVYRVEMEIEVTRKEHTHLMMLSQKHYDGHCQSVSKPGRGSFLYGWQWHFVGEEETEVIKSRITWREFDTLCKIVEGVGADPQLIQDIHNLFLKLREETARLNNAPL